MKLGVCMLWTEMRKTDLPFSADLMLGLAPVLTKATHLARKTPGPAKRRPKRAAELRIAVR